MKWRELGVPDAGRRSFELVFGMEMLFVLSFEKAW